MAIPNSVLKERIKDVEAKLIAEGLKALVVYSTGSSLGTASRTHGYLRYLLDWDSRNGFSTLVLTPERNPFSSFRIPPFNASPKRCFGSRISGSLPRNGWARRWFPSCNRAYPRVTKSDILGGWKHRYLFMKP